MFTIEIKYQTSSSKFNKIYMHSYVCTYVHILYIPNFSRYVCVCATNILKFTMYVHMYIAMYNNLLYAVNFAFVVYVVRSMGFPIFHYELAQGKQLSVT